MSASVLYKQSSLDSEAGEFLNPNKLSPDGTISISTSAYSEDGRYFAYGLSEGGSDWITVHVRHLMNIYILITRAVERLIFLIVLIARLIMFIAS